ncbi:hypothetical protein [Flavobacterium frigidarium]|jgi:hypothetical protein|uniref:Uncharacterized protein n=1 Tax=Flavobacterium frigidarium TaxID=99286 RepID=A0ABV4KFA3_9FLAO|nr:hypothetical protein [Bacteroidota bacterium]MDG1871887.1 hypothetical protein [Flavobacterium sp.]|tara:strand:- start:2263 stop:2457 length:195 start_codon:yes stop_codon:yes gene_type:complete
MKALNTVTKAVNFLKNLKTRKNIINISVDDLVHPRFGFNDKEIGKAANSLQFLMYSKENDTLFI